jgi:hypothetical protein
LLQVLTVLAALLDLLALLTVAAVAAAVVVVQLASINKLGWTLRSTRGVHLVAASPTEVCKAMVRSTDMITRGTPRCSMYECGAIQRRMAVGILPCLWMTGRRRGNTQTVIVVRRWDYRW